jgi:hypothetical protein
VPEWAFLTATLRDMPMPDKTFLASSDASLFLYHISREELLEFPDDYLKALGKEKFITAMTSVLRAGFWQE